MQAEKSGDGALSIQRAVHRDEGDERFPRVWDWRLHSVSLLLSLGALAAAAAFIPVAFLVYWVLLSATARAFGVSAVSGGVLHYFLRNPYLRGWPADVAAPLGVLTAIGVAYLLLDHIALLGNTRAQSVLARKAAALLDHTPLPESRFFVQIQAKPGIAGDDIGWLYLFDDRLVFVGDRWKIEAARESVGEIVSRGGGVSGGLGLGDHWIEAHLPDGELRLLSREASRLSETAGEAFALADRLRWWRRGPVS